MMVSNDMITRISTKGQIVLPVELREKDGIEPGQEFEIVRLNRGDYRLKRKYRPLNEGVVDWQFACPVKGWLQPLKWPGTTDTIRPIFLKLVFFFLLWN